MADRLQNLRNVVSAQNFVHEYLPCLHVHTDLGDLHTEAGHSFLVLTPAPPLANARIAHRLYRDAPGRESSEVKGAATRGVCTDAAGTPLYLVYRDTQGLGHLPLQCLAELQDTQVRRLRGRDCHAAAPHPRVVGEV